MHKEFESNKDLIEFSRKYERSIDRFLMIRSMNKKYILDFYKENKTEVEYSKEFDLMNALFNSDFETSIKSLFDSNSLCIVVYRFMVSSSKMINIF